VTGNYVRVTGLADLLAKAWELSVKTMIFDVEPLVAPWNSSRELLDRGIAHVLGDITAVPAVRMVVFATNSARRSSIVPTRDSVEVGYLASADKWLKTAPYCGLPRPGAVAGDQVPTDGVLAYRLRFYVPALHVPAGRRSTRARARAPLGRARAAAAVPAVARRAVIPGGRSLSRDGWPKRYPGICQLRS
jgi:hypothetical protein